MTDPTHKKYVAAEYVDGKHDLFCANWVYNEAGKIYVRCPNNYSDAVLKAGEFLTEDYEVYELRKIICSSSKFKSHISRIIINLTFIRILQFRPGFLNFSSIIYPLGFRYFFHLPLNI